MEFNQKLQELRKQKGLTQDELATKLYVSRTAISKWESGRGFPNIDSLKDIARFFSVTVDELLSSDEILLAEQDGKEKEKRFRNLLYGLLDLSIAMLFFLPFFGENINGKIQSLSLIQLSNVRHYLKIAYFVVVSLIVAMGFFTLILQNWQNTFWIKYKAIVSIALGVVAILLFTVSLQPYPAVFSFVLLGIKTFLRIKL